ncbi:MAG: histidine phosphatase family protein [Saprospiraceae bacterium]|nr:histidine phosphatase family protein [Saprospiraceae bacterium]
MKQIIYFILTVFSLSACKQEQKLKVYDGKYIKEIKSNAVILDDGDSFVFDTDSTSKIFYLIRHAEKDTVQSDDPPLSEAGNLRGARLADLLRGTRVDAIYSTFTIRTLFTVDSLADIKSMVVLPYDNKHLSAFFEQIGKNDDLKSVLIVGHSNTIPSIANSLTGKEVFNATFADDDYDNFVIITHSVNGEKKAYPLKYKP